MEADRNKDRGMYGLAERMRDMSRRIQSGEYVRDPNRPVDPYGLAARMRAQCERNAARELAEPKPQRSHTWVLHKPTPLLRAGEESA